MIRRVQLGSRANRRTFLVGTGASLAALTVPALGRAVPALSAAATHTISTPRGKVTIPVAPKRVVCVDGYSMGALFDVGFRPIGVLSGVQDLVLAKYAATYQSITKVGDAIGSTIDLEKVAAQQPDLILGLNDPSMPYDKLTAIAPTVLFTWDTSGDWQQLAEGVASAVGRGSQERALKGQYTGRASALRANYADILTKTRWDVVTGGQGQAYVWQAGSDVGMVLVAAGVRFAGASANKTVKGSIGFGQLSFEQLGLLSDADVLIVRANRGTTADPLTQAMMQQPTWKLLKAAKQSHVYPLSLLFPFSYGGALVLLDELEVILRALQGGH